MNKNLVKVLMFTIGFSFISTSCSLFKNDNVDNNAAGTPTPVSTETPGINSAEPSATSTVEPINTDISGSNSSDEKSTKSYKPVIVLPYGNEMERGYVMGGSKGSQWIDVFQLKIPKTDVEKEVDIDLVRGGEVYKFYSAGKLIGEGKGSKPVYTVSEGSGSEVLYVNIKPFPQVKEDLVIGINGDWNAVPSMPRKQTDNLDIYLSPVINATGFDKAASIKDVTLVDIDGDGAEEAIVNVVSSPSGSSPDGVENKSLVVLEKKVNGEVKYIKLHESYFNITPYAYDLNGDGKMEIVLEGSAHEEYFICAYVIDGGESKPVVSFYEGA